MTASATDQVLGPASHASQTTPERFARRPVLAVTAVVALAHLLVAATTRGRWFDEALTSAIGRYHLDWGAADQPPMAPLLAAAANAIAPGSTVALAAPAIAATAMSVVLAALIARELGGDARAQTLAALAQGTGLWVTLTGHWLTPYTLEPVFWVAIAWLLVRWTRVRDDRLLLALGIVVGLGAETKFQIVSLCAVLLVAILVAGPRELLRRRALWGGVAVAALLAAPTMVWQAANGWPQLAMAGAVAQQGETVHGGRLKIATEMLAYAGPLGLGLSALGVVALLRVPRLRNQRFLAVAMLALFVLFVIPPGRPSYLVGAYGILAAVGACDLHRRRETGRASWRWATWLAILLSIVTAGGALVKSVSFASPVVADSVVDVTVQAYQALPLAQRARTVVMGDTFIYAAYLDTASPERGLPVAASGNVSYGYFPAPAESQNSVLLVGLGSGIGTDLGELAPFFAEVRPVAHVRPGPSHNLFGGETTTTVWLLTGKRAPWAVIWPAIRTM